VALIFVGVGAWNIGNRLSTDAVSMAIGLVFGVFAVFPTLFLIVFAARQPARRDDAPPPVVHVVMLPPAQPAIHLLGHDVRTVDGELAQSRYSIANPFGIAPVQPAPSCMYDDDGEPVHFDSQGRVRKFEVRWNV
jgi:hypothetical protein